MSYSFIDLNFFRPEFMP
jgi:hypothetical protein